MGGFWMDGNACLRDGLAASAYGSAAQAVASLTQFTHPTTVQHPD